MTLDNLIKEVLEAAVDEGLVELNHENFPDEPDPCYRNSAELQGVKTVLKILLGRILVDHIFLE